MAQMEFQNVFYKADEKVILNNISFDLVAGDYVSVIGPSGSGKSTFLKLCCHLLSPTEGIIKLNGMDLMTEDPIEIRKRVSYCFQIPILFGDTVEENLTFPYSLRNQKLDMDKINLLFNLFGMNKSYFTRSVQNLSGGEKQRLALIRTLLFRPEVLLLDEVTSALDTENARIVEEAILGLNREGITILWVTHNLSQSRKYANKLLTFENGQISSLEELR